MTRSPSDKRSLCREMSGVALLEVLIASFILGLFVIPVSSLFLTSAGVIESVRRADTALNLAQGVIEDCRALPFVQIMSISAEQEFDDYQGYRFTLEVSELKQNENIHLKELTVTVSYQDKGKEKTTELTTRVADYYE